MKENSWDGGRSPGSPAGTNTVLSLRARERRERGGRRGEGGREEQGKRERKENRE